MIGIGSTGIVDGTTAPSMLTNLFAAHFPVKHLQAPRIVTLGAQATLLRVVMIINQFNFGVGHQ